MKISEAFVLRKIEFSEADYIISLFTRDYGKIKGLAKNAKKSRKRFGGRLEPFVHFQLRFRERLGGMKFIEDAETIRVFSTFMGDIQLFIWGSFILENIEILLPEEEPNNDIFDLLVHTLSALDNGKPPLPVILNFQLTSLSLSGYKPNFDSCAECGNNMLREAFFSIKNGGMLCKDCGEGRSSLILVSKEPRRLYDTEDYSESISRRIKLLSKFTEYHTGKEFKSSKFIKELNL